MPSYDEHLEFLIRNEKKTGKPGDRAERIGFQDAKEVDVLPKYSEDRNIQNRYADGFFIGKEKLRFDVPTKGEWR